MGEEKQKMQYDNEQRKFHIDKRKQRIKNQKKTKMQSKYNNKKNKIREREEHKFQDVE